MDSFNAYDAADDSLKKADMEKRIFMSRDIRKVLKEIDKGKNLEENLPVYLNCLADSYRKTAVLHMAFHYDTLFEQFMDREEAIAEDMKELTLLLEQSLNTYFQTSGEYSEILGTLLKERSVIIEKMQVLTAYVDRLSNYEYVLNRLEPEFHEGTMQTFEDEEFIQRLRIYLFKEKDPVIANDRIREVVGQLPVRMAKSKFYDILEQSIGLYKNNERESLESFLYMIRTAGSLYTCDGMERYFLEEKEEMSYFDALDYDSLTTEEYDSAVKRLTALAAHFEGLSDDYVSVCELLNELIVCILTDFRKDEEKLSGILKKETECLSFQALYDNSDDLEERLDQVADLFIFLEGEQESAMERKDMLEAHLSEAVELGSGMENFKNRLKDMEKASMLLTSSVFAELPKPKEDGAEVEFIVSDYEAKKKAADLIDEFDSYFKSHTKRLNRAVMANTLSKVPVFFHNSEEVTAYVTNALTKCKENSEKTVCMYLLNEILEENGL